MTACPFEEDLVAGGGDALAEHLLTCASCRELSADLAHVREALDLAPLDRPAAARWEGARGEVLAAATARTAPACPGELDLLAEPGSEAASDASSAHVAGCASCATARVELARTRAALDALPLERPDPARWADLRSRVLTAAASRTAPACPRELDLLATPEGAAAASALEAHLAGCAVCAAARAELSRVRDALDAAPLARPDPARWAGLKARVLASSATRATRTAPANVAATDLAATDLAATDLAATNLAGGPATGVRRSGAAGRLATVLRLFVPRVAAAALVVAAGLGVLRHDARTRRLDDVRQAREDVRRIISRREPGWTSAATDRFQALLELARDLDDPLAAEAVAEAELELEALRRLARIAPVTSTTAAAVLDLSDVVAEFPDALATSHALDDELGRLLQLQGPSAPETPPARVIEYDLAYEGPGSEPPGPATSPDPRHEAYVRRLLLAELTREPHVRQASLVQAGQLAEELGRRDAARASYERAVAIDPASRGGRVAAERLAALRDVR